MIAELSLALLAVLPQGADRTEDARPLLDFPQQPAAVTFVPFRDAFGAPARLTTLAAGAADFDGDRNADAWMLAGPDDGSSQLSIQYSRTSSLGRFRDGHVFAAGRWTRAATFRSSSYSRDRVLLVDPANPYLSSARYYLRDELRDPPRSGAYEIRDFVFHVGAGAYEIATRDDAQDGHDDVAVLRQLSVGSWEVRKLLVGQYMMVQGEVSLQLPFPLDSLTLLDVDHDGRSDVLARVPGVGVAALRDQGDGTFGWYAFVAIPSGLQGMFIGDFDGDQHDDVGFVLSVGVALFTTTPAALQPRAALLCSHGRLAAAGLADANGDGHVDVVGLADDGRALLQWFGTSNGGYGPAEVRLPYDPFEYLGAGPLGMRGVFADFDDDGDDDLLLQLPSGAAWHGLLTVGARPLAPGLLETLHLGPVGETGYHKQQLTVGLPPWAAARGLRDVEVGVFLEDPRRSPIVFVYWGRLIAQLDAVTNQTRFNVYYQTDQNLLIDMLQRDGPDRFGEGITAGGNVLLTIHAKDGAQRFGSLLLHHDGSGDGNKSAKGVRWQSRAAPPKPSADADLLPWD